MLNKIFCIIGTDTEIGKTYITCNLIKLLQQNKFTTLALKPVASGKKYIHDNYINEDVYNLSIATNARLSFQDINPICFTEAIAPHIAANNEGFNLSSIVIKKSCHKIISRKNTYDYLLIEGIGGIHTPLNLKETYIDLLKQWKFPIILVVGIKLGCLNHTLLTNEALQKNNLPIIGWIANLLDNNMLYSKEHINYLQEKLTFPLIAINPFNKSLQPTDNFCKIIL